VLAARQLKGLQLVLKERARRRAKLLVEAPLVLAASLRLAESRTAGLVLEVLALLMAQAQTNQDQVRCR
jgi:hypothetical protein